MPTTRKIADHVSVSGLRHRGWTDKLILDLLGEPDKTAPNPHYRSVGAPVRLYALARVVATEHTAEFVAAKRASDRRRQASEARLPEAERNRLAREAAERLDRVAVDKTTFPGWVVVAQIRPDRRGGQLTIVYRRTEAHVWLVGPMAGGLLAGCGSGGLPAMLDWVQERPDLPTEFRTVAECMCRGDIKGYLVHLAGGQEAWDQLKAEADFAAAWRARGRAVATLKRCEAEAKGAAKRLRKVAAGADRSALVRAEADASAAEAAMMTAKKVAAAVERKLARASVRVSARREACNGSR